MGAQAKAVINFALPERNPGRDEIPIYFLSFRSYVSNLMQIKQNNQHPFSLLNVCPEQP